MQVMVPVYGTRWLTKCELGNSCPVIDTVNQAMFLKGFNAPV